MAAKIRKRHSQSAATAVALTIAGSDSSAGAGIQADLKTFAARGVYGLTAVTCIVAEIPGKVSRIQPADPLIVHKQIEVLFNAFPISAAKTGLLCNAQIISAVVRLLRNRPQKVGSLKLVVDPVMIATSGDVLLEPDAIAIYERELFPLATLLTPNLDEAMQLLGEEIRDLPAMRRAVKALAARYKVAVLLKGGHLRGRRAVDLLYSSGRTTEVVAPYLTGVRTHGTGCTYSAAIAAELAKGADLDRAVRTGKDVVSSAIKRHFAWKAGRARIVALNPMAGIRPG
jgi:hydroxymethylpyrimidine/phosphomethylpyrimidine kinase